MLWRDRLVQSIFACQRASTYHVFARTIFEHKKLKYLTELEIYLFVSRFIYFHTLCLREAWTLLCLGVCADRSKCSLLADAVSTACRPNMSTNPKPFSAVIACPEYQAFRYAWVRARFYRFLIFTMGGSRGGIGVRTPPPGKSQVILVSIGDKQLDPPPPTPLKNVGSPLEPRENDSLLWK